MTGPTAPASPPPGEPAQAGFRLFLRAWLRRLHLLEDALLVLLTLSMIGISAGQIFLRNIVGETLIWGDVLTRMLVLWAGLAGAMAAGRSGNHIRIDVAGRYLPPFWRKISEGAVSLFTAAICAMAAWWSYIFVAMEKADGIQAFARIPAWICESIIPLAFAVLALRYTGLAVCAVWPSVSISDPDTDLSADPASLSATSSGSSDETAA